MDIGKEYYLNVLKIPVNPVYQKHRIKYAASDGKLFDNELECTLYDEKICRIAYYERLISNRNWFMRFFNIKPSMKFYDEIQLKVTLNRLNK